MDRVLSGGQVQRVDLARAGSLDVALLQLRIPGETVQVLLVGGSGLGVLESATAVRVRAALKEGALADQARWRAHLESGRLAAIDAQSLAIDRGGALWWVDASKKDGALSLSSGSCPKGQSAEPTRAALAERGASMAERLRVSSEGARAAGLRRALAKALTRTLRRGDAIRGDLEKMRAAQGQADRARLFVTEAAGAPRGRDRLVAVDWTSGEARDVELAIDPAKSAREQIDAIFARARRLKEGARIGQARLSEALVASERLTALAHMLAAGEGADFDEIEREARLAAPSDFERGGGGAPARAGAEPKRLPYRAFVGASGRSILVGKGAAQNDALTLHVARPRDMWLHAKNVPGAHVIVPLPRNSSCPADLLVEAAHLAVHFSSGREERMVDVQYTPRKYVRKPRGVAPGAVSLDREKVLALRRDDALLKRLLGSESVSHSPLP